MFRCWLNCSIKTRTSLGTATHSSRYYDLHIVTSARVDFLCRYREYNSRTEKQHTQPPCTRINNVSSMEEPPQNPNLSIAFGLFVNLQHLSNFVWKWLCVEKGRALYCNYVRQAYNNYNNYQLSANNTLRTLLSIKITLVSSRYLKLSSLKWKGHGFSNSAL